MKIICFVKSSVQINSCLLFIVNRKTKGMESILQERMRRRENGEELLQANKNKGVFMFCKGVLMSLMR